MRETHKSTEELVEDMLSKDAYRIHGGNGN